MDEDDVISWQEFVDDPSVSLNTRRIRKMVIGQLAKANVFESPTLLLDRIRLDRGQAEYRPRQTNPLSRLSKIHLRFDCARARERERRERQDVTDWFCLGVPFPIALIFQECVRRKQLY